jgi:polysaccharide pyruvyl transferase WcaK-like protein
MSKFALVGNGPLSNRGCEAIVYSSIDIIKNEFGDSEFLLASFANDSSEKLPNEITSIELPFRLDRWSSLWWQYRFRKLLGLSEDLSYFLRKFQGRISDISAVFSIGGDGYSIDYGHTIIDRLIIMNDFFHSNGIPIIIWGASIGPFGKEPEFEQKIALHLSKIDLIVVRESISLEYLHQLGIRDNVCLACDPAFVLEPKPCQLNEKIEQMLRDQCIGLNLSPLLAKYATNGSLENWTNLSVKIVRRLLAEIDLSILLIPHATFANLSPLMDDEYFLRGVYNMLTESERKKVALLPRNLSSQNLKWIISQTSLFIGARTHATIAALSSYVPCISIAYSRKAWGINEMIFGHRDWVYSSENLDANELTAQVKKLLNSSKQIRMYLNKTIPSQVNEIYKTTERIRKFIT